ncbi:uncharacterized protein CC84DRAFT_1170945 [Paraphaeosphaeria sporulosa]|uniref:Uncharacterized protein n=1 Tax=Paraphaeosphaeria sporulosa TaxID=1460663 RepID=A0A177CY83_9PLEO|nr:uncharacterized protein CC84DRAFT_1170945 [Paraphaeosphaeria sporulosa]OAG12161.1 hypothetical protein CC84DRAFT_1170945 [Paraphaeosphaeria sporulosa]
MSTDPPPSRGSSPYLRPRLSLSTVTSIFPRPRGNSKSPHPDRPSTGNSGGWLSPLEPSRSRSSSTSRSIRSISSKSPGKWIRHLKRSRSASINSAAGEDNLPLKREDFKEVEGWFDAFQKYNRLITNQVSGNSNFPAEELSKIQKTICEVEGGRFINDLPEALFDIALLWCPAGEMTRKSVTESSEPSWSWTAWNGAVNFPFDPSSCPDVRRRGEAPVFFKSKITSFVLGPESGCERYTIMNRAMSLKLDPISTQRPRIEYPTAGLQLLASEPPKVQSDTLRFTAQKVDASAFKMEQIYDEEKQPLLCTGLIDSQDRPCGVLMDYKKKIVAHQQDGKLHYILLSVNRRVPSTFSKSSNNISHPSGIPIWKDGRFLKEEEIGDPEDYNNDGEWKMYNVMLIQEFEAKTLDDGSFQEAFARRVAVGRIHEDAWNEAMKTVPNRFSKIVLR